MKNPLILMLVFAALNLFIILILNQRIEEPIPFLLISGGLTLFSFYVLRFVAALSLKPSLPLDKNRK